MKIFLTGAEGQLGRELRKRLAGTDLMATDLKELDITDAAAVADMIGAYRPDVVIHGAAWTQVDVAEEKDFNRVSALGYALGYLGGGVLFAGCVLLTLKPEWFGLTDKISAVRWAFCPGDLPPPPRRLSRGYSPTRHLHSQKSPLRRRRNAALWQVGTPLSFVRSVKWKAH